MIQFHCYTAQPIMMSLKLALRKYGLRMVQVHPNPQCLQNDLNLHIGCGGWMSVFLWPGQNIFLQIWVFIIDGRVVLPVPYSFFVPS